MKICISSTQSPIPSLHHGRWIGIQSQNVRVIPRWILCRALSLAHPVFPSQQRPIGQGVTRLHLAILVEHTCSQLDAIPTVGFSDPILSYFSALKLNFDGVRMLQEGYEKVILNHPHQSSHKTDGVHIFLDKTRSIQSCHLSEVVGTGFWARFDWRR